MKHLLSFFVNLERQLLEWDGPDFIIKGKFKSFFKSFFFKNFKEHF
jgi:hypothetical protein